MTARRIVVALFALAVGCDDPEDALPGSYSGTLDSTVTASRITNMRADGGVGRTHRRLHPHLRIHRGSLS